MPERMSGDMPEKMSKIMSEDTSEKGQTDCQEIRKDCQKECQKIFYSQNLKLRVIGREVRQGHWARMVAVQEAMKRWRKRRKMRGGGDEADIKSYKPLT